MTFDDLIRVASEAAAKTIPPGAEKHLKHSISAQTQEKLLEIEPNKAIWMIIDAVNEVNHGSIKTIEELILKSMTVVPGTSVMGTETLENGKEEYPGGYEKHAAHGGSNT